MTPQQAAEVQAIRARHEHFQRQYSPGPNWEPYNQMHRDIASLLAFLDQAQETFGPEEAA